MSARAGSPPPTSVEIRAEIERTREAMDATLVGLGEQLSPSRLVRVARQSLEERGVRAVRAASRSPVTVVGAGLLIGFIVGQLVGRRR